MDEKVGGKLRTEKTRREQGEGKVEAGKERERETGNYSVADPHLLLCGSGSRIQKMSIWIRILGLLKKKTYTKKISTKSFKLTLNNH